MSGICAPRCHHSEGEAPRHSGGYFPPEAGRRRKVRGRSRLQARERPGGGGRRQRPDHVASFLGCDWPASPSGSHVVSFSRAHGGGAGSLALIHPAPGPLCAGGRPGGGRGAAGGASTDAEVWGACGWCPPRAVLWRCSPRGPPLSPAQTCGGPCARLVRSPWADTCWAQSKHRVC